jgi:hypothetical protein
MNEPTTPPPTPSEPAATATVAIRCPNALTEPCAYPQCSCHTPAGVYLPLTANPPVPELVSVELPDTSDPADITAVAAMLSTAAAHSLTAEVVLSFGQFRAEGDDAPTAAAEALLEWDI